MDDTFAWLAELGHRYRRIWVIKSGTHPYFDLKGEVEQWLIENFLRVRDAEFFSHSSLHAQLYLPEIPVFEETPKTIQHPVTAEFGDLVGVVGFDLEPAVSDALPAPLRLYWQVTERPARRYKYIFQMAERLPDGQLRVLTQVEREPYEGDIPTTLLGSGQDDPGVCRAAAAHPCVVAGARPGHHPADVRRRDARKAAPDAHRRGNG